MRITLSGMAALVALTVVVGLSSGVDEIDPHRTAKNAQAAILALSEKLDAPDVKKRAEAIVREYDSEDISSIFRRTRQGGLGVGVLASGFPNDSVEYLVRRWTSKPPTTEDLEKNQREMLRITKAIRAMSELAPYRVPGDAKPNVKKEWAEVASEFHDTALGLDQAVEKKDPKAIREAARKINNTCCHCHSLRD
jgi:hypothetical protein